MPTPEALAELQQAAENMRHAQQEHLAFVDRPNPTFSVKETAENKRLLDNVNQSIAKYWQAFDNAAKS